jgi:fructokinase
LELGLPATYVRTVNTNPTGWVSVEISSAGQPTFTIHRPAAYDDLTLNAEQISAIQQWRPDWLCFGTLHQMEKTAQITLESLLATNPGVRRFYDVNLRPKSHTPELVKKLMKCADTVKVNETEAEEIASLLGFRYSPVVCEEFCRKAAQQLGWRTFCITRGEHGCALLSDGAYVEHSGKKIHVADTIGAGDAFSAALLHGLSRAWPVAQIAEFANRLGAFVASRPGAIPNWTLQEVLAMTVRPDTATP